MIYVITAYRWGWRNGHSYVVGADTDKERALVIAQEHVEYRGGKYGCEVVEVAERSDPSGDDAKQVAYVESPYFGMAGCSPNHITPADKDKPSMEIAP